MKRLAALILCLVMVFSSGCGYSAAENERAENSYELYFREVNLAAAAGGDALRVEDIILDDAPQDDPEALATMLVEKLLAGPMDPTLRSPFPAGTALLSLEVEGDRARVDMSPSYQTLSGVALTLADYAITLTLTQIPEIAVVSVTVRGQELAYRNTQSFAARDVLFSSTEDVVGTVVATLYFLNQEGNLVPQNVELDLYEGDTQVGAVVAALELMPEGKELISAFPNGFRVKSAWLEEDVCYVNLSSEELLEVAEQKPLTKAVWVLVQSLLSLESVKEVRFMVDGEFAQYYGRVPISEPYHE